MMIVLLLVTFTGTHYILPYEGSKGLSVFLTL